MADMTLEEALAAATVDEELVTPVNEVLLINPETRTINVPDSEKLFGTRQDMDVERKYFKCPRIVGDNIDLFEHRIFVNYVPSKQDGSYDAKEDVQSYWCKDLAVEGDFVTFSWELSGNAMRSAGYIAFAVYAKTIDEYGNLKTKWHTTIAIGNALDTLPDGEEWVTVYPDIVMQLLGRMDALESVETLHNVLYSEQALTEEQKTQARNNIGAANSEEVSKLSEEIADQKKDIDGLKKNGTGTKTKDRPYHIQKLGILYDNPEGYEYIAWCPGNIIFDSAIGKFVVMVYGSLSHMDKTNRKTFVVYIDPLTYEATEPVACLYDDGVQVDGVTAFWIDSDGKYRTIIKRMDVKITSIYTSSDNGVTWNIRDRVTTFDGTPWGITKLSNGRLIGADDVAKVGIYYSDDEGLTWTNVIPETCGGGYEAEAKILELEDGKLIAIARYSMSGKGYYESGASEPAIVSFSDDYGTTWTPWKPSETITNMNASSCAGYVHNGVVDVFAGSRWYWNGDYANEDFNNTGHTGAITHYTATVENALKDNFTNIGVVTYSNAIGAGSSQDFHCPALAIDDFGNMLLMWFDRIAPYTEEKTTHYFARGSMGALAIKPKDDVVSSMYPYSSEKVVKLLNQQKAQLVTLFNEAIQNGTIIPPDSGGGEDTDITAPTYFILDELLFNFDFTNVSKYDSTAMTLTDSYGEIVGTFTTKIGNTVVSELPVVREYSIVPNNYLKINKADMWDKLTSNAFSVEFVVYKYDGDEDLCGVSNSMATWQMLRTNTASMWVIQQTNSLISYYNSENTSVTYKTGDNSTGLLGDNIPDGFKHIVWTFSDDGKGIVYVNGEITTEFNLEDFVNWGLNGNVWLHGHYKNVRFYNKTLSVEEVSNNYYFEKNYVGA